MTARRRDVLVACDVLDPAMGPIEQSVPVARSLGSARKRELLAYVWREDVVKAGDGIGKWVGEDSLWEWTVRGFGTWFGHPLSWWKVPYLIRTRGKTKPARSGAADGWLLGEAGWEPRRSLEAVTASRR